jgi:hypothetical protein
MGTVSEFELGEHPLELTALPASLFAVGITPDKRHVVLAQCLGDGSPWQITLANHRVAVYLAKQIMDRVDELET